MERSAMKHNLATLLVIFAFVQIGPACKATRKPYTSWNNTILHPPDIHHTLLGIRLSNFNNTIVLPDETEIKQPLSNKCFLQAKNVNVLTKTCDVNPLLAQSCNGAVELSIAASWPPVIFSKPSNSNTWNFTHIFYNCSTPKLKCNPLKLNDSTESTSGKPQAVLSISLFLNILLCQSRRKYIRKCRHHSLTTKQNPPSSVKNEIKANPNKLPCVVMKPPVCVTSSAESKNGQEDQSRTSGFIAPPPSIRLEYARADIGASSRATSVDYLTPIRQNIPEYLDFNESRQ